MKPTEQSWKRLVEAARRAPASGGGEAAPYGFATRVAALAFTADRPVSFLFARFSRRAMGIACLAAILAAAANYSSLRQLFDRDTAAAAPPSDDPIADVANLAS